MRPVFTKSICRRLLEMNIHARKGKKEPPDAHTRDHKPGKQWFLFFTTSAIWSSTAFCSKLVYSRAHQIEHHLWLHLHLWKVWKWGQWTFRFLCGRVGMIDRGCEDDAIADFAQSFGRRTIFLVLWDELYLNYGGWAGKYRVHGDDRAAAACVAGRTCASPASPLPPPSACASRASGVTVTFPIPSPTENIRLFAHTPGAWTRDGALSFGCVRDAHCTRVGEHRRIGRNLNCEQGTSETLLFCEEPPWRCHLCRCLQEWSITVLTTIWKASGKYLSNIHSLQISARV